MRVARRKSESGIYHVMVRGINKQDIFIFDTDRIKYLEILKTCKEISGFELYAYCLMDNHLHLLLKEKDEPLDLIMKRIGSRFVGWYNWSHGRTGHLFQDRFKSEPVETDEYFLTVLRYILQNPVKAGICNKVGEYRWSSYADYRNCGGMTDTTFAIEMRCLADLLDFFEQENEEICLEDERVSKAERDRRRFIQLTGCYTAEDFSKLNREQQHILLRKCKQEGLSAKCICQNSGCSDYLVRKI